MEPVIDDPRDLTAAWCAAILGAGGVEADIAGVEVEPIGTGQTGAAYRLTFRYRAASPDAPPTLVAKLAAGPDEARRRVAGGYRKEVEFYRRLAPTVDISTPRCWHAAIDDDNSSFTLLLDDIADARVGAQADGCSLDQAVDVVENAAGLHAPHWNDAALLSMEFLTPMTADRAGFLADLARRSTDAFIGRYGSELTHDEQETLRRAAAVSYDWMLSRRTPFAVVHGDYRLDNFMFGRDRGEVTVLDWQTVAVDSPVRDVAYFLSNSLEPDVRRSEESALVEHYHDELVRRGVSDYDFDRCFDDYRLGQLQGPFITVIGSILATADPSTAADEMFLSMARRSCAAVRDLDSFSLVPTS